jgi:2,3-bisphosphoglycerate-independent phosphoglycerate mutase
MVSKDASDKQEKILFILIDGVGDVGIPQFGGKTALCHANTPFLDIITGVYMLSNGSEDPFIQPFLVHHRPFSLI